MCSVQEDEHLFPEKATEQGTVGRKCMKCQQPAVVIIRINDPFCKDCFLSYCTHKFRSSFGKSKLIRDQETVLVAFSGGKCSSAMRHLIQEGLSKRAQKKLRFIPSLVCIDDGCLTDKSDEERFQNTMIISEEMKRCGLTFFIYSFEQVFEDEHQPNAATASVQGNIDLSTIDDLTSYIQRMQLASKTNKDRLVDLLSSAKSLTAKENLIFVLRQRLLLKIAKELGYSKVLVGDSVTRLSIRLLSNITQGRGSHLPYETSFADPRDPDILLIRPMREFSDKEITIYNHLNNIECVFTPTPGTKLPAGSSLDRLAEEFVLGLQADYPNTVSTIFRTGEKLDMSAGAKSSTSDTKCALCQAPLDTDVGVSSALTATEFSQNLAHKMKASSVTSVSPDGASTPCSESTCSSDQTQCCEQGGGECHSQSAKRLTGETLRAVLCYGCRLVAKDLGGNCDRVPSVFLEAAAHQLNRLEMKKTIQDFLLDETQ